MAALVLGAAGGLAFGPIGFLVGSMVGNLLFPTKQYGPRLSDLRMTGSSYGQMIPIIYGVGRPPGSAPPQVVWQTDLTEHQHDSGGKGGPDQVTFTYSASWAMKFAKGPIGGFQKIWFNSTLVYDNTLGSTTDNTQINATFYLGTEDALPDPTMEAKLGVGNVPAFRDDAAIVFTNQDLSPYGNTIPQISAQMFSAGGTIPWRVSTFDTTIDAPGDPYNIQATYDQPSGVITIGVYSTGTHVTYSQRQFLLDGTPTGTPTTVSLDPMAWSDATNTLNGTVSNLQACFCYSDDGGGDNNGGWFVGSSLIVSVLASPSGGFIGGAAINGVYQNGFIYAISVFAGGTLSQIRRWAAPEGVPTGATDLSYFLGTGNTNFNVSVGGTTIFVTSGSNVPTDIALWWFNEDLTLIHSWLYSEMPLSWPTAGLFRLVYYNGMLAFNASFGGLRRIAAYRIDPVTFLFTLVGDIDQVAGPEIQLQPGHGMLISEDGIVSLDPPPQAVTLASIISDVSVRDGLNTNEIDVSKQTQLVDFFVITNQTDGKTALAPLQRTFYVDAAEESDKVVFVNRGGDPILTIPDNDLAAQAPGATPPPIATVKRMQEVDLTAVVNVNYMNELAAYQIGTQQATRQVTRSQAVATIDLAVAMTDGKAKQVAYVLLFEGWQERMSIILLTSRKYAYLEPTDVISAHGYTLRIIRKSDVASGIIQLECVETLQSIYTASLVGNPTSGWTPSTPGIKQLTDFLLLDIPLLQDTDNHDSVYGAPRGHTDDTWKGCSVFKSSDNGTTYQSIATASTASVVGTTQSVLGDFFGGNVFDELNHVDVLIGNGGGELAGVTELAALNNANEFLIGSEIVNGRDAVLIAPKTYRVSGLLRGRRGTGQFTGTHIIGENFVAGPFVQLPTPTSDLYQPRLYKPVTFGGSLAGTAAQSFTDTGNVYKPYSPGSLGGGADASGNVTINWVPRTRFGGAWIDYVDISMADPANYVVQIWDATYTLCARVITGLVTPTCSYTAAQQVTDFGRVQTTVFATVAQIGSFTLGTQAQVAIAAGGAGNDLPITPVHPYVIPPVLPPPGPTNPVNLEMTWPVFFTTTNAPIVGQTFVAHFTTTTVPSGSIKVAEYLDSPHFRKTWFATDSGGINRVGPYGISTTAEILIGSFSGAANLLPSTSYYWLMQIVNPDGSPDGVPGSHVGSVIDMNG